jgi:hypothetical protein
VRGPCRVQERSDVIREILASNPWEVRITEQDRRQLIEQLAPALLKYSRPDNDSGLACNVCCHYEFFAPNFPDEAATKGWKPW